MKYKFRNYLIFFPKNAHKHNFKIARNFRGLQTRIVTMYYIHIHLLMRQKHISGVDALKTIIKTKMASVCEFILKLIDEYQDFISCLCICLFSGEVESSWLQSSKSPSRQFLLRPHNCQHCHDCNADRISTVSPFAHYR